MLKWLSLCLKGIIILEHLGRVSYLTIIEAPIYDVHIIYLDYVDPHHSWTQRIPIHY